jgi:hypothetical protein
MENIQIYFKAERAECLVFTNLFIDNKYPVFLFH